MYTFLNALGDDRAPVVRSPGDQHLCSRRTQPIRDSLDLLVLYKLLLTRDVVPEGAIRGDMDVVLLAEVDELPLR